VGWPPKNIVNQDKGEGCSGGFATFPRTKNAHILNLDTFFLISLFTASFKFDSKYKNNGSQGKKRYKYVMTNIS